MIMNSSDRGPNSLDSSSSESISETVNGSHHFTIRGYSLAKGMGPGKYIQSDTFSVGGYEWVVCFYPDGKDPEDSSIYVSVYLALASEGTDVRAIFELTLLDQSGEGKHRVYSHSNRPLQSGPYTLKHKGSMWGYKQFFRRTALETSDFLKDDCLVLNCTLEVVRTRIERPKLYRIPVPPSDIGENLKYLLDSEFGCDIVFQVGKETFKAHKLILATRSPVFKAQFFGLVGNPTVDKVELEDIEPSIFKAVLQFIYSDNLVDLHEITGSTSTCTCAVMLAASDRFGLDRLKELCEAELCEEISADTVATTLSLAEQHHCPQLKAICLEFVATNMEVVMQSEGFRHLEKSSPLLFSELLETVASMVQKSIRKEEAAVSSG